MTARAGQAGTRWDPARYARYGDERLRPALDLLARVDAPAPRAVVDLGSGTGNVTRLLAERWPAAEVEGIDHSPEMIAAASAEPSPVRWTLGDIARWRPAAPVDVLFSNAALHWLGEHDALLPRLLGHVAPGGWLAVQMPLNWAAPSHRLMRETLADGGPGGAPIGPAALREALAVPWVAEPAAYHDLLAPRAAALDVWETTYLHVLEGEDPVLRWVEGTGLRPVLAGLEEADRAVFVAAYARRLRAAYPCRADGRTLLPFRRLFIVARA